MSTHELEPTNAESNGFAITRSAYFLTDFTGTKTWNKKRFFGYDVIVSLSVPVGNDPYVHLSIKIHDIIKSIQLNMMCSVYRVLDNRSEEVIGYINLNDMRFLNDREANLVNTTRGHHEQPFFLK